MFLSASKGGLYLRNRIFNIKPAFFAKGVPEGLSSSPPERLPGVFLGPPAGRGAQPEDMRTGETKPGLTCPRGPG